MSSFVALLVAHQTAIVALVSWILGTHVLDKIAGATAKRLPRVARLCASLAFLGPQIVRAVGALSAVAKSTSVAPATPGESSK